MTEPVLRLEEFGLTDLHVHWEPQEHIEKRAPTRLDIGYAVHHLTSDPTRYRLTMTVRDHRPSPAGDALAQINATIVGFFAFPEATKAADREQRIRFNGLPMLYGALRGALATACGVLPAGFRYVLPTVNMLDVIKTVESQKAAELEQVQGQPRRQTGSTPKVASTSRSASRRPPTKMVHRD